MEKIAFFFAPFILICSLFGADIIPFDPGEGAAREIFDEVLPFLDACLPILDSIPEDIELDIALIEAFAEMNGIPIEPANLAILSDPFMAAYAFCELERNATENLALSEPETDGEAAKALLDASELSFKRARVLKALIEGWTETDYPCRPEKE